LLEGKEPLDRPVVGLFNIIGKIAGGQFVLIPVISHAIAADPFTGTRLIGTIASFLINCNLAFHGSTPWSLKKGPA
jgi:hypothetical protein